METALEPVRARFVAARKGAAPIRSELRAAVADTVAIKGSLRRRRQDAVASVQRIEKERDAAREEYDESVWAGVSLGIVALVLAIIAFTWGWFRASVPVAYLARMGLGRAIGLCVGGGLLVVIVGGAMSSIDGILGAVGYVLVPLGFVLPVALVLARHSVAVQGGRANARFLHQGLPTRARQAMSGVLAAVFLLFLGTAVFADEAQSGEVGAQLRARARSAPLSSPALAAAEARVSRLEASSAAALALAHRRRAKLIVTKHRLERARVRRVDAEEDAGHFTRRLAAIEERELRAQEREEREAQRQAEVEEREAAEEQGPAEDAEGCDPNYEGACLHEGIGDYDCEGGSGDGPNYVAGPIYVVGVDEFGLDSDGDGVGCEDG